MVSQISTESATAHASKANIRAAATQFAHNWKDARSEQAERQSFWNAFFQIFGVDRRRVAAFERLAERASTGNRGWIDMLNPGQMAVEHKSAGEDLDVAMGQLIDYLPSLTEAEMPWLLVVCDFQRFKWENLETGERGEFPLSELPDHIELFWWIAGYNKPGQHFGSDEDANLAATRLLANVHDRLAEHGYPDHDLREWMTRILFVLFADDTGIWDRAAFHTFIALHTKEDGSDLGQTIALIFEVLNTPPAERQRNLDEDLASLTYVNGDLFADTLRIPVCDKDTRDALLWASVFNWASISPAVFGSLFQNVMEPAERRQLGAHYTTEQNILRTIRPLFLNDLEAELAAARTKPALKRFIDRLGELSFLDPACGCGNFLVIAYRELRRLETEALRQLREKEGTGQLQADVTLDLRVTVDQFYGIELEEFPAKIARTALYLADHIANRELSAEFGQHVVRFPIPTAPHIEIGNALRMDWESLVPADSCDFVFGNPPFGGHQNRTREQSDDLRHVWGRAGYNKLLDYVTGWYRKGLDFDQHRRIRFGFVSTNSIGQGEQVARLWQILFDAGYRIDWAHQTFAWTSEARGMAHVHVVIVGFSHNGGASPTLFTYDDISAEPVVQHPKSISPYFVEGPPLAVAGRARETLSAAMPPVRYGSLPSDGGGLSVTPAEYPHQDAVAQKYLRPYYGSKELVRGIERWVIWMPDGPEPGDLSKSQFLSDRLGRVRRFRVESVNPDTQDLADQPYRWFHNAQPTTPYIGIPAQVSQTRRWYTIAHLDPEVIASNTLYTADDPSGFLFALLSSSMFMSWIRSIGGAIKSDLRYSKSIVHNTFPLPTKIEDGQRDAVIDAGKLLLAARDNHAGATLRDLYEPLAVPADVVAAHDAIDKAVDRIFDARKRRWDHDNRVEHLLGRYVDMVNSEQLVPEVDASVPARRIRRPRKDSS